VIIKSSSHSRDLGGGIHVRRLLPAASVRAVGPFVFMDHLGPLELAPPMSVDVRPHPHIGLATVTYLFEGALLHRDTLGSVQRIEPGAVNWMTAGRGIAHSERTPPDLRAAAHRLHGLQLWVGLPRALEESAPSFSHTPAAAIPRARVGGGRAGGGPAGGGEARTLIGSAFGERSPVPAASQSLFVHLTLPAGEQLDIDALAPEAAIYPVAGTLEVNGERVESGTLAVLKDEHTWHLEAREAASLVIVGGAPLDGPRHLWWNFVSSSPERIRDAAAARQAQKFGMIAGESEFIPLPELPPAYR
jgi:redox-sensitive bicupin YhaK (pirin superfamily)